MCFTLSIIYRNRGIEKFKGICERIEDEFHVLITAVIFAFDGYDIYYDRQTFFCTVLKAKIVFIINY